MSSNERSGPSTAQTAPALQGEDPGCPGSVDGHLFHSDGNETIVEDEDGVLLRLPGRLGAAEVLAALRGYRIGYERGRHTGAAQGRSEIQRGLLQLLGAAPMTALEKLETRMEDAEHQIDWRPRPSTHR